MGDDRSLPPINGPSQRPRQTPTPAGPRQTAHQPIRQLLPARSGSSCRNMKAACIPLDARAGSAKLRRQSPAGNSSLLRSAGRSSRRVTKREIDVSRSAHIAGLNIQLSRMADPVGCDGLVLCPLPRIGVVAIGSRTDFLGTEPERVGKATVCWFLHSVLNSTRLTAKTQSRISRFQGRKLSFQEARFSMSRLHKG